MAGEEVAGGTRPLVSRLWASRRVNGSGGEFEEVLRALAGLRVGFGFGLGTRNGLGSYGLADLDKVGLPSRPRMRRPVGVMFLRGPDGGRENVHGGLRDGFEAGEAV